MEDVVASLPSGVSALLDSGSLKREDTGMSNAHVYEGRSRGDAVFLKISRRGTAIDLRNEVSRLLWARDLVPVPRVLYFSEQTEAQYLLMSAIPGVVVYHEALRDRLAEVIRTFAESLRRLHELPVEQCPFDEGLDAKLAVARRNLANDDVQTDLFDPEHQGHPVSLFEDLLNSRPESEDLVVTHGDYCTPNVLLDQESLHLTGFLDLGRMGVADRYHDLALAARSIAFNFGELWVQPFFEAYGIRDPDEKKCAFYRLLDEFL